MSEVYEDDFEPETTLKKRNEISLDNFDPLSPVKRLSSPISIEVCKAYGIPQHVLFHKSYMEVKEQTDITRRNDKEYIKMKYFELENQRLRLVDLLRRIRKKFLRENDIGNTSNDRQKLLGTVPNIKPTTRNCSFDGNTRSQKAKLDKSVVEYLVKQKDRVVRKEVNVLIKRFASTLPRHVLMQHKSMFHNRNNISIPPLATHSGPITNRHKSVQKGLLTGANYHKTFVEELENSKVLKTAKRLEWENALTEQHKVAQINFKRQRFLVNELREERKAELKRIATQCQEEKRVRFLQKIEKNNERSWSLFRNREALKRFRQEINKKAAYHKYIIKRGLETDPHKMITGISKSASPEKFGSGVVNLRHIPWKIEEDTEVRRINEKAKRLAQKERKMKKVLMKLQMYTKPFDNSYITISYSAI